jgi:hypothetical protein
VGAILGGFLGAEMGRAAPVELITAAEAAQPDPSKQALLPVGSGPSAPGAPQIIVEEPKLGRPVNSPFSVKIRFVPSKGSRINLDSLKFQVLKRVPISMLPRVKPYLTAVGINVPEVKIPPGTYNVRIAVADDRGRQGVAVHILTVH